MFVEQPWLQATEPSVNTDPIIRHGKMSQAARLCLCKKMGEQGVILGYMVYQRGNRVVMFKNNTPGFIIQFNLF